MRRKYFVTPKELSSYLELDDDGETIRKMCERGEFECIKVGNQWRITTIGLRKKWPLSTEFWTEVTEDLYRGLNGETSCRMRLERRRKGINPTTGEKDSLIKNSV